MIKPKFTLLQVEIKRILAHSTEANKTCFSKGPETLDTIDVRVSIGKFILAMLYPEMLLIPQVHQTIISAPAIRMDNAFKVYTASDYALESCL